MFLRVEPPTYAFCSRIRCRHSPANTIGVHFVVMLMLSLLKTTRAAMILAALMASTALVQAQTPPGSKPDCATSQSGGPATPVENSASGGSKNIGATGWSGGGLGGSHNHTSQDGSTSRSRPIQPELARGLDPTKSKPRRTASATDGCVNK